MRLNLSEVISMLTEKIKNAFVYIRGNLSRMFGCLAVFVLLCLYPAFMMKGYFGITAAKQGFFCLSAGAFAFLCLFSYYLTCSSDKLTKLPGFSAVDISMLLFLFVSFFSCISSSWRLAALSGAAARRMGFVTMIAVVMAYFLVSRFYSLRRTEFLILGFFLAVMSVFAILQFMGFDPFGLLRAISARQRSIFIGFSGNVNMFGAIMTIFVPVFMTLFCFEKNKLLSAAWFVFAFIGLCGILTSNSDGALLGMVTAFAVLLAVSFRTKSALTRCMLMFCNLFLAIGLFAFLKKIFAGQARTSAATYQIFFKPYIYIPGLIVFAALAFIVWFFSLTEKHLRLIKLVYVIAVIFVIFIALLIFIYFSFINKEVNLGKLEGFLRFSDNWGNGRGFVWKKALELFKVSRLPQKLIGYGEDTTALAFYSVFGKNVFSGMSVFFDNVHNYFLQFLVTLGAWGLVTYTASLGFALGRSFKDKSSYLRTAVAVAICAYIAQSTVNITQTISTPMLFVFLGLSQSRSQVN